MTKKGRGRRSLTTTKPDDDGEGQTRTKNVDDEEGGEIVDGFRIRFWFVMANPQKYAFSGKVGGGRGEGFCKGRKWICLKWRKKRKLSKKRGKQFLKDAGVY